jgi:hypothetical protein
MQTYIFLEPTSQNVADVNPLELKPQDAFSAFFPF